MHFISDRRIPIGVLLSAGLVAAQDDPYAPVYGQCPEGLRVRDASTGLSRPEASWKTSRGQRIIPELTSYLNLADIDGFNVQDYIQKINTTNYPVVGLAVSGGGTQSGLGGLGVWQAYDSRNPAAVQSRTGGLTQLLSYITGLSGGGALTVSTLAANDFVSIADLRKQINFTVDYQAGKDGPAGQEQYIQSIFEDIASKAEAGFPVTVADAFGRFWATYLPENKTYANFSDLTAQGTVFARGDAPMPIVVLSEVIPGQSPAIQNIMFPGRNDTNGFNLTSYEVTPFEFGSWRGGRVQAFMPTMYLGTSMSNGTVQNTSECVTGFDKYTLMQGSTANAFNAWFIADWFNIPTFAKRWLGMRQTSSTDIVVPPGKENNGQVVLVSNAAKAFNQTFNESLWSTYPNPFQNFNPAMQNVDELLLIDGSLSGETDPIRPLIIPERKVDFIIVYEASSDAANGWINGTNLINSAQSAAQGNIPFPRIPDVVTLVTQNMTKQPTFFGCNETAPTPLVLYLPNAPWSGYSNFSYMKSSFTDNEFDLTVDNAFQVATYGNSTVDANWPACLACATIRGSLARLGLALPQQCQDCFTKHCWNGTVAAGAQVTPQDLDLRLRLNPSLGFQEWNETYWASTTNKGGASSGGSMGGTGAGGIGNGTGTGTGTGGAAPSGTGGSDPNGASSTVEMGKAAVVVTVASLIALIALL